MDLRIYFASSSRYYSMTVFQMLDILGINKSWRSPRLIATPSRILNLLILSKIEANTKLRPRWTTPFG